MTDAEAIKKAVTQAEIEVAKAIFLAMTEANEEAKYTASFQLSSQR